MVEILGMTVTFSLPDWVGKYDYTRRIRYGQHHCWKGQVKEDKLENEVMDVIDEEKMPVDEVCLHPMGRWIKFHIDIGEGYTINVGHIVALNHTLHEILEGHFKSGRRKPHGSIY